MLVALPSYSTSMILWTGRAWKAHGMCHWKRTYIMRGGAWVNLRSLRILPWRYTRSFQRSHTLEFMCGVSSRLLMILENRRPVSLPDLLALLSFLIPDHLIFIVVYVDFALCFTRGFDCRTQETTIPMASCPTNCSLPNPFSALKPNETFSRKKVGDFTNKSPQRLCNYMLDLRLLSSCLPLLFLLGLCAQNSLKICLVGRLEWVAQLKAPEYSVILMLLLLLRGDCGGIW